MPSQPPEPTSKSNISLRILQHAHKNHYAVPGIVIYNLETLIGVLSAAHNKSSPVQLLLFPWAQTYAGPTLVDLCHSAARTAKVPISLHLDHAQSAESITAAAETGKFDSIMVDMSHYEKGENLRRTKELTAYCHSLGIATEAEPGRINGGEAGIADTGDLEGILTTPEEAQEFIDTGIDFLAPAFGNVHGAYNGVENIHLDYPRLEKIREVSDGKVMLVMHGTNEFNEEILRKCVNAGMTRLNVNQLVLWPYEEFCREKAGRVPLTEFMDQSSAMIQERVEWLMDVIGSTGRASEIEM